MASHSSIILSWLSLMNSQFSWETMTPKGSQTYATFMMGRKNSRRKPKPQALSISSILRCGFSEQPLLIGSKLACHRFPSEED